MTSDMGHVPGDQGDQVLLSPKEVKQMQRRRGPRVHRWSSPERRGCRSFLDVGPSWFVARFERYWLSGAEHTGLKVEFDDEPPGVQVFAGVAHVACGWLTVGSPDLAQAVWRRWKRSLPEIVAAGVSLHDRAVWWEVWHDKWGWKKGTPRWRSGNWQWFDALAGKAVYRSEVVSGPHRVQVPLPERSYPATVTLTRDTWTRRRWWTREVRRFTLDVLRDDGSPNGYLPIPGKGESAWDCGPDGTYSITAPGHTVEHAIAEAVESVLTTRSRRGAPADYSESIG